MLNTISAIANAAIHKKYVWSEIESPSAIAFSNSIALHFSFMLVCFTACANWLLSVSSNYAHFLRQDTF